MVSEFHPRTLNRLAQRLATADVVDPELASVQVPSQSPQNVRRYISYGGFRCLPALVKDQRGLCKGQATVACYLTSDDVVA
jgi:hypothetical protein